MKLFTWSAKPAGRRLSLTGTNDDGDVVTLDDVIEIRSDERSGERYAARSDDQDDVLLS